VTNPADTLSSLVSAFASLAWPIIIGIVVLRVLPVLRRVLESRGFTLKIAGFELTAQQATEQFHNQISDLQEKVVQLRQQVDSLVSGRPAPVSVVATAPSSTSANKSILWLDDKPTNNALEMARLQSEGFAITQVTSTTDALAVLDANSAQYAALITDMGRRERGIRDPKAGITFISAARKRGIDLPILVYTAQKSRTPQLASEVQAAGGNGITASPVELLEMLHAALQQAK